MSVSQVLSQWKLLLVAGETPVFCGKRFYFADSGTAHELTKRTSSDIRVPHRRRQALVGWPDFSGPNLAWHVEDAAVRKGKLAIARPPKGICAFVVGYFKSYGNGTLIGDMALSDWHGGKVRGDGESLAERSKTNHWSDRLIAAISGCPFVGQHEQRSNPLLWIRTNS